MAIRLSAACRHFAQAVFRQRKWLPKEWLLTEVGDTIESQSTQKADEEDRESCQAEVEEDDCLEEDIAEVKKMMDTPAEIIKGGHMSFFALARQYITQGTLGEVNREDVDQQPKRRRRAGGREASAVEAKRSSRSVAKTADPVSANAEAE
jgi:hypothetical protein